MPSIVAATLNIRNIADRWTERLPLLLADMAALQPDVLGLQEVVFAAQQDRLLGAAGEGRYDVHRAWAGRPEYGNAILVKAPATADATDASDASDASDAGARATAAPTLTDRLDLGHKRSALWVPIRLPDRTAFAFVATHLHHEVPDEAIRDDQVRQLLAWLASKPEPATRIVVGDFNARPVEPAYARMRAAGFRSASVEANGHEPSVTWPSGIQAPGMDTDGEPGCLDYVWLAGDVHATSCRLVFDRPAVGDPTLYPSDHIGLAATLQVGR